MNSETNKIDDKYKYDASEIKTINLFCSCGGFCSQLYFIISWLVILQNKKVKLYIKNNGCLFNCHWKRTIKDYNLFDNIIDIKHINKLLNQNDDADIDLSLINNKLADGVQYNGIDMNKDVLKINNLYSLREIINHPKGNIISLLNDEEKFTIVKNEINKIINKYLIFNENILKLLEKYTNYFNKYVIGLHIRSSQHYKLTNKYTTQQIIDNFFLVIEKKDKPDDFNIFIATSNKNIIKYINNKYPQYNYFYIDTLREDFTINESNNREFNNNDWSKIPNYKNKINEFGLLKYYYDVCLDLLLLSKCNHIIGGESNVFFNALCINKETTYSIPKILQNSGHL